VGVLALAVGAGVVAALDDVLGAGGPEEPGRAVAPVRIVERGARSAVPTRPRRTKVFELAQLACHQKTKSLIIYQDIPQSHAS